MPSWSTPAYSPDRSLVWPNSFYYLRTDAGGANLPGTVTTALTNTAAYHAARSYGELFRFEPFGPDEWAYSGTDPFNPPVTAGYFQDVWPSGTVTKTNWTITYPAGSNGTSHLYFANLRQENAYQLLGNYQANGDGGTDRHAVLWAESFAYGRELVEAYNYNGTSATAAQVVTYDLTTYTLPNGPSEPAGVVAARIPVAPFQFTYADLVAAGTGDLGHMIGWVAANYENAYQWPARREDGELVGNYLKAGSVIRLKSSWAIPSGWPETLKALARTLQRYGAVLFDKNSKITYPTTTGKAVISSVSDASWPSGGGNLRNLWAASGPALSDFEEVDITPLKVADGSIEITSGPSPTGPTASFTAAPTSGAPGLTVAFTNTSTAGDAPIIQWSWSFGDGDTTNIQNPSHIYFAPGTYTVKLVARDSNGLEDAAPPQTITITSTPDPPVASFTADTAGGVEPLTVHFDDTSTAGSSPIVGWYWDFGGDGTSTSQNPTHTFSTAGSYPVYLTVTDANGLTSTSFPTYIDVTSNELSCVVNLVSTGAPVNALQNSFSVEAFGGTGPYTYEWDFGDGTSIGPGNYPTASHTYASSGTTPTVTVTTTDFLGATTTCSYTLGSTCGTATSTSGLTATLFPTYLYQDTFVNYTVDWGDGNTTTTTTSPITHEYAAQGTYAVEVCMNYALGQCCNNVTVVIESAYQCIGGAEFEWQSYTANGFIANPPPVTLGANSIRIDYEDSSNCGGPNPDTQTVEALGTFTTSSTTVLSAHITGLAELQNGTFDMVVWLVKRPGDADYVLLARGQSTALGLGCEMGPLRWDYVSPEVAQAGDTFYLTCPSGVTNIKVIGTTNDGLYHVGAFHNVEFTCSEIPVPPDAIPCAPGAQLGFGQDVRVFVTNRGATQFLAELTPTSGYFTRTLDETSELEVVGTVTGINGELCCDDWSDINPWVNEIYVWRDGRDAWCGPVTEVDFAYGTVTVKANDLTAWWDRRVLPDLNYVGQDLSTIFNGVHAAAMAPSPVPNFTVVATPVNEFGDRNYSAGDYKYASDALKELADTAIDWTCFGRTVIVGGEEVPATPYFTLTDDYWTVPPTVKAKGNDQATQVVVRGEGVAGVATSEAAYLTAYGLVTRVFDATQIKDPGTAQAAARTRLALLQDPNYIETPTGSNLSPYAPITLPELIPGIRVRVQTSATCRPLTADFRLKSVKVEFGGDVSIDLQPLGSSEIDVKPKYAKMVVVGDSLSAWSQEAAIAAGSGEPFSTLPSDRWQDVMVKDGFAGYSYNGAKPGLTTRSALATPIAPFQTCGLLVIYLGANDMVRDPAAPATWILPAEYKANLISLAANYPHDKCVVVFPWKWNGNFTDPVLNTEPGATARHDEYKSAALSAADAIGASFLDLSATYNAPIHTFDPIPPYMCDGLIHCNTETHAAIAKLIEGKAST